MLDTLSAAYIENGDFKNAWRWMNEAIKLDDRDKLRKELETHRTLFKKKQPLREP